MAVVEPPVEPMLAKLARELPTGELFYEPKWDGFRCLAFLSGDTVDLRSRNDRPLARYFPEVVEALRALPFDAVLDGELLACAGNAFDFNALLARLHPAASRAEQLARETPAVFVAFDVLAVGTRDLREEPFRARRAELERLLDRDAGGTVRLTPSTHDADSAEAWLGRPPGEAIDGVVAKTAGLTYQPGRRAMIKVKPQHTIDCVVAGMRLFEGPAVASLLLGLYDDTGNLEHVGVSSSFRADVRRAMAEELLPLVIPLRDHPWAEGFGGTGSLARMRGAASRWTPEMTLAWLPLRPECVCEVAYDQREGHRFRHPARFCRWRDDRVAASCTLDQLQS